MTNEFNEWSELIESENNGDVIKEMNERLKLIEKYQEHLNKVIIHTCNGKRI